MSSPPYVSILLKQPADGATVFIRRFTRDPPVQATWNLAVQQFVLFTTAALTIVGGTYAGTYQVQFMVNILGKGVPGWGFIDSARFIGAIENPPGTWELQQTDLTANAFESPTYAAPFAPHTATVFTTTGSPAWSPPTSMAIAAPPTAALIIPASLVQAWRPL